MKRAVAEGRLPGPRMFVSSVFLEGPGAFTLQMPVLAGPTKPGAWSAIGTKPALTISRPRQSPQGFPRGGHRPKPTSAARRSRPPRRVSFREAAALGIDDLEHGLPVDSDFVPAPQARRQSSGKDIRDSILKLDVAGPEIQETIRTLVAHKVA